jgi:hypothetical protein
MRRAYCVEAPHGNGRRPRPEHAANCPVCCLLAANEPRKVRISACLPPAVSGVGAPASATWADFGKALPLSRAVVAVGFFGSKLRATASSSFFASDELETVIHRSLTAREFGDEPSKE